MTWRFSELTFVWLRLREQSRVNKVTHPNTQIHVHLHTFAAHKQYFYFCQKREIKMCSHESITCVKVLHCFITYLLKVNKSQIQAAKVSFLHRAEVLKRENDNSSTWRAASWGVWVSVRMTPRCFPGQVFQICLSRRRPQGQPTTLGSYYSSQLNWECPGIPP